MSSLASEIEDFLREGYAEVEADMIKAGEAAVAYNVEKGDYRNVTGNLRRSNYFEIEHDGEVPTSLIIGNRAHYASDVEARKYMVASGGALLAETMLKDDSN